MAIRRHYNNPYIAQAAANLSEMFRPPSGAEAAAWASANAKKEEAARLAQLFDYAWSDEFDQTRFDRAGIAANLFDPTQSYYAVDQSNLTSRSNNAADNARALREREMQEAAALERLFITDATDRRGQDITARTSIMNNVADNRRQALTQFYQPLNPGQVRPEVPDELSEIIFGSGIGAIPSTAGLPKPLSMDETRAAVFSDLPPDEQRAIVGSDVNVESVVTPEGPRVVTRRDAVGQEPFVNKGAEAKPDILNYRTPDGRVGTAIFDGASGLVDSQTRESLPAGTQTFKSQAQGAADEVLGQTTSNRVDQQLIDVAVARNTAVQLRDLIASSPASQGAVGWLRGTAQNVIATGGELGQFFGGQVDEINKAIASGLADESLGGAFDPNIPAIEMMANLLAFQYAKTTTGERLSNEMLRASRAALGLDKITANQQDSLARLNTAIDLIEQQEAILRRAKAGGVEAISRPAAPAPGGGGSDIDALVDKYRTR